jgi:hypothetical protein
MVKLKVLQKGEQLELDLATQKWLDKPPVRAEKMRFEYHFSRLKKSMFCDLKKNAQVSARFGLIIEAMSKEFPSYDVLDGGQSYKLSEVYKKLWRYHHWLVRKWQTVDSPQKFPISRNSSNSKSTALSSEKKLLGKSRKK